MLRNTFQQGYVSVFCSDKTDTKALQLWKVVQPIDGHVSFVQDEIIGHVLQIKHANISTTRIELPGDANETLGITLPHCVLQVRPLDSKSHWSAEVGIVDAGGVSRALRISNYVEETRITPEICHIPCLLEPGRWQSVSLDLARLCHTSYGVSFSRVNYVVIHANIRLRRVYFAENNQGDLPFEFQLTKRL